MLGFTVPLFVLLGFESLLALLLLGPRSLAGPALFLCKSTRSSVPALPTHGVCQVFADSSYLHMASPSDTRFTRHMLTVTQH